MSQIAKLAISGTVLGGAGIGIAYASGLFDTTKPQPKLETKISNNTKNKLTEEGFEVLDTETDVADWQTILTSYHKATKSTFTKSADTARTKDTLRNECKRQLALETKESYLLARQWCVKEKSVTDVLGDKHALLNTAKDVQDEKSIWTQKVRELKATKGDEFKELREKLNDPNTDEATLKTECKNLKPNEIKTTSENFNDVLEKTKNFCAK